MKKIGTLFFLLTGIFTFGQGFHEGFEDVEALITSGGWARQNLSNTIGNNPNWKQGSVFTDVVLPASSFAFAGVGTGSVLGTDTINNWLFTPNVYYNNGDTLRFYSRTVLNPEFPDRLQVRLSAAGTSINAGSSNTSVGDFTILLSDINQGLTISGYPSTWTQYQIVLSGLSAPGNGRFAFRYYVPDGGPSGANSDYIGIDEVQFIPTCNQGPLITLEGFTSPTCFGINNGSIDISISGGLSPLQVLWSNGSTSQDQSNIFGGDYIVHVKDNEGCQDWDTVTVLEPYPLFLTLSSLPVEFGNDGIASVGAIGGTPPYQYSWSPYGGDASIASNLEAGTFTVTITDWNGCQQDASVIVGDVADLSVVFDNSIGLFPNPSDDQVTITLGDSKGILEQISVLSLDGKQILLPYISPSSECTFSVTGWEPGIYLINVWVDGNWHSLKPLVKF